MIIPIVAVVYGLGIVWDAQSNKPHYVDPNAKEPAVAKKQRWISALAWPKHAIGKMIPSGGG